MEFVCNAVDKSFTVIYLRMAVMGGQFYCFPLEGQMNPPQNEHAPKMCIWILIFLAYVLFWTQSGFIWFYNKVN